MSAKSMSSMAMASPMSMSSLSTVSMSSMSHMSSMSNVISSVTSMGSMSGMNMVASTTNSVVTSMSGMVMSQSSKSVSTASSMTTGMSGMEMSTANNSTSMEMGMNSYLTRKFKNYPVLFEKLYAKDKRDAFGIFVLILAAAFVYKLINFTSWCLEVHWFKKWNKEENKVLLDNNSDTILDTDTLNSDSTQFSDFNGASLKEPIPQLPNLFDEIFAPNLINLSHDVIRILLIFTSTMVIYMLMLAAMSFVLTYVFAVITGLSLSEVFFNRCKMVLLKRWEVQRTIERINKCPGGISCRCGKHKKSLCANDNGDASDSNSINLAKRSRACGSCKCDHDAKEQERDIERNILESNKLQEQGNDMDANLLPAEKYK